MTSANLPLKPIFTLLCALTLSLTTGPVRAKTFAGQMPGHASAPASCLGDSLTLETEDLGHRAPTLVLPRAEPAFRGLFVLVLPWAADRHLIEARRRLQFALRLDEPQEPAFKLTLRF